MISVYIKFIWMVVFTFLIFFIVRSVHSETMGDLIWEKGIYYKKNTNVPFSGEINGNIKGQIQDGKKEGTWVRYYSNGQLFSVSNYKTGRKNGAWITYNNEGHLIEKGQYKNDLEEGHWIRLFENGEISYKGMFKNGKKSGSWVAFYYNGQLKYQGNYKNGTKDGYWEYFSPSGYLYEDYSGYFKNNKKISSKI